MIKDNDFIGMKFGRITILEKTNIKNSNGAYLFKVQCDCNKIILKSKSSYTRKKVNHNVGFDGCGCFGKIRIRNLNKLEKGEAAINSVICQYKNRAKTLGFDFCLTKERATFLILNNCEYCGSLPINIKKTGNGNLLYNGIDRLDNTLGYTEENTISCCIVCNKMKLELHWELFIDHILKIQKHITRFNNLYEAKISLMKKHSKTEEELKKYNEA